MRICDNYEPLSKNSDCSRCKNCGLSSKRHPVNLDKNVEESKGTIKREIQMICTICKIEIKCIEKPNYYEMSIADNGPGIKEENQKRIFDLFENLRTKRDESTGIGLATVKKAVTETNGRVWVESKEDQGAKFLFTMVKKNKK